MSTFCICDVVFEKIDNFFSLVEMPDFGDAVYPMGNETLSQDESESTFENKSGLADDLKFLASMPELCDVTFLVGDVSFIFISISNILNNTLFQTREPVCAVKVIIQKN